MSSLILDSRPETASSSKSSKSSEASKTKRKKVKQTILSTVNPLVSSVPALSTSPQSSLLGTISNASSASPSSSSSSNSNVPCRFFQLGQCNKGNSCPFIHKKAAHFSPQPCKFFANGFCRNGDACPFSHDPKLFELNNFKDSLNDDLESDSFESSLVDLHDPRSLSTNPRYSSNDSIAPATDSYFGGSATSSTEMLFYPSASLTSQSSIQQQQKHTRPSSLRSSSELFTNNEINDIIPTGGVSPYREGLHTGSSLGGDGLYHPIALLDSSFPLDEPSSFGDSQIDLFGDSRSADSSSYEDDNDEVGLSQYSRRGKSVASSLPLNLSMLGSSAVLPPGEEGHNYSLTDYSIPYSAQTMVSSSYQHPSALQAMSDYPQNINNGPASSLMNPNKSNYVVSGSFAIGGPLTRRSSSEYLGSSYSSSGASSSESPPSTVTNPSLIASLGSLQNHSSLSRRASSDSTGSFGSNAGFDLISVGGALPTTDIYGSGSALAYSQSLNNVNFTSIAPASNSLSSSTRNQFISNSMPNAIESNPLAHSYASSIQSNQYSPRSNDYLRSVQNPSVLSTSPASTNSKPKTEVLPPLTLNGIPSSTQSSLKSPLYSPLSADSMPAPSTSRTETVPFSRPSLQAFRRQSSIQLGGNHNNMSNSGNLASKSNLSAGNSAFSALQSKNMIAKNNGSNFSSSPGGKPAPFNRSRSTDQNLIYPRSNDLFSTSSAYLSSNVDEPIEPKSNSHRKGSLTSLNTFLAFPGHGNDDFSDVSGAITPTSTSSTASIFDQSLSHGSPRSNQTNRRQSIGSAAMAYAGSGHFDDSDTFSSSDDEDDYSIFKELNGYSSGSNTNVGIGASQSTSSHQTDSISTNSETQSIDGQVGNSNKPQSSSSSMHSSSYKGGNGSPRPKAVIDSNAKFIDDLLSETETPSRRSSATISNSSESRLPPNALKLNLSASNLHSSSSASSSMNSPGSASSKDSIGSPSYSSSYKNALPPGRSHLGGPPIPMLARTRRGSFSKSHEDLLAGRSNNPNFGPHSLNPLPEDDVFNGTSQLQYPHHTSNSSYGHVGAAPPTFLSKIGKSKTGLGLKLTSGSSNSLISTSQSSQKVSQTPHQSPIGPSYTSTNPSPSHAGNSLSAQPRVPPRLQALGKSMSETGPQSQMQSSIMAWKEKKLQQLQSQQLQTQSNQQSQQSNQQIQQSQQSNSSFSSSSSPASSAKQSPVLSSHSDSPTSQHSSVSADASKPVSSIDNQNDVVETPAVGSNKQKENQSAKESSLQQTSTTSDSKESQSKENQSKESQPKENSSNTTQQSANKDSQRKQQLCMFFIDGACRYGDSCKFVHGSVCNLCKKPCLFPDDLQQNEKHAKTCRLKLEIEESKDLVCALCKLKVVEHNRKFGLLPECSDVICVPCLKEYRTSTSRAECPVCQAPSHFLIPSHSFPQNPDRKKEMTEAFKLKMSKIACKYFDNGNGVCKYGEACHFHHNIDPNAPPSQPRANSNNSSSANATQNQNSAATTTPA